MPNLKLTLSEQSVNRLQTLFLFALILAVMVPLPILGTPDSANAASAKRVELGKKNLSLDPNCGRNFVRECTVEGKVTAYQALSKKNPGRNFVVPFDGKVVSWSIKLAKPLTKEVTEGALIHPAESPFFNELFGSPAQARIAVLRQVEKKKKGPPRYKMVRQSPVQVLNPYFGTTVQFALSEPLNVYKNNVIALTIPTWAPIIWKPAICNSAEVKPTGCIQAERDYTWRGSRAPDKCDISIDRDTGAHSIGLQKTRPQQKVDSVKRYGCYYGSNVLLYSATIVGP
ncbi:MAG TPA: hypothetical protein VMF31_14470 [Solirubrobacterales bacterium]|nr:hypothetical protein [Solirubrobacterales bacterium]